MIIIVKHEIQNSVYLKEYIIYLFWFSIGLKCHLLPAWLTFVAFLWALIICYWHPHMGNLSVEWELFCASTGIDARPCQNSILFSPAAFATFKYSIKLLVKKSAYILQNCFANSSWRPAQKLALICMPHYIPTVSEIICIQEVWLYAWYGHFNYS